LYRYIKYIKIHSCNAVYTYKVANSLYFVGVNYILALDCLNVNVGVYPTQDARQWRKQRSHALRCLSYV